ncbi:methyltransferase domain-containing protein [Achromobacter seleniivolatilans]|uniref:Methyltransferase domain-containing protein n=1 Tax=Achromobacter seleniivolatilans TaxID=3047478 RepID=A0ABY9M572_9BURK|nr:methyltransferase domain-containing protein [Achromobacter sp. R39]WMD22163.1 methyltransferase domain-containing protein [Achromobacter sp. R39]
MYFRPSCKTVAHPKRVSSASMSWLQERKQFIKALLNNPAAIGAVAPSGAALAAAITASIQPRAGKVLELGCGTGVFTREMLRRGVHPSSLVLVEQDTEMSRDLRKQFPEATVLQVPAQELSRESHPELDGIGTTICGLPLRNMSGTHHQQLLAAVFGAMRPGGAMHLFTYGVRCPISPAVLAACGVSARRSRFVPMNLPPASVYSLTAASA